MKAVLFVFFSCFVIFSCHQNKQVFSFEIFKNENMIYKQLSCIDTIYDYHYFDKDSVIFSLNRLVNEEYKIFHKTYSVSDSIGAFSILADNKEFLFKDLIDRNNSMNQKKVSDDDIESLYIKSIYEVSKKGTNSKYIILFGFYRLSVGNPRMIIALNFDGNKRINDGFAYKTNDTKDPQLFDCLDCITDYNQDDIIDFFTWNTLDKELCYYNFLDKEAKLICLDSKIEQENNTFFIYK